MADQDWTDEDFVLGAVLAQIEDLEPEAKRRVLNDALFMVYPDTRDRRRR